jgi:hypothetical protein
MILREYLYVDSGAVRGLLAQIDSGISEGEKRTEILKKVTSGGVKGFAEHGQDRSQALETTKSFGDAIFPLLEEALQVNGLLRDISEMVAADDSWRGDAMEMALPAGTIVRLTAPGYLMDARFIAAILSGFAVAARGLTKVVAGGDLPAPATLPPKAKNSAPKGTQELPWEADGLEGKIPLVKIELGDGELSPELLRGITQVARGMFAPGLHLSLVSNAKGAGAISVRLQEGRQYLDTDPDVLFGRYGVGAQDWTIVGTIGCHPQPDPDMSVVKWVGSSEGINRAEFGRYVNQLATMLGNLGFTDLPQAPGFSIVPWAVYRTLGGPNVEGSAGAVVPST